MGTPRFICILLRGGMDGMAAITRPADPHLENYRRDLLDKNTRPATDGFAFHPALKTMHNLFQSGELSFMHAAGLPMRNRSHFKSQDCLEGGTDTPHPASGWLGRAVNALPASAQAVAYGSALPLILKGGDDCFNWSNPVLEPKDKLLLQLLTQDIYPDYAVLNAAADQIDDLQRFISTASKRQRRVDPFKTIGEIVGANDGPDIGVISLSGWDTHDNQMRRLMRLFADLDTGLATLKDTLGQNWPNTAVVIASEFGRTLRGNGTKGTDHGTAGAAFITGGAIRGGQSLGEWPGLGEADLYEGRDLYPLNDIRHIFASVMENHLRLPPSKVQHSLFPGIDPAYQSLPLFGSLNA